MAKFSLPFAKKINHSEFKLYINARILDPESGFDAIGYLLTKGDKIIDFKEGEPKLEDIDCDEIIDCQNHLLCPALIDIHRHRPSLGLEHRVPHQMMLQVTIVSLRVTPGPTGHRPCRIYRSMCDN